MDYCRNEHNCLLSYRYKNRLYLDIHRLINERALRQRLSRRAEVEALKWTWNHSVSQFELAMKKIVQSQN